MTRITDPRKRNAISVLQDIFEMNNMREPVGEEVDSLLETIGTHASLVEGDVLLKEDFGDTGPYSPLRDNEGM
ncbi:MULTISPECIES: hypothetical protein [Methanohalophilus]|jgi:hypothetical protein|uniref:Uncharacterized protein n=1 Tax=Methanohalophilus euhalobius TaxID=51203 RepID=A0A285F829_9EURY|nr:MULTISPECIES: hypothetical protein [Methanohalophilus]KXS42013.1 MAG: hypothetical protein AWU58_1584 [Methanohalophilus sp. T328-1]RSD34954.1 MAG: hypothetical protein CI953_493 [Methanohalophilus sp.]OBZ35747.1 MAG: hypothetical protein A9957_06360 [Methanohalophilus sp. DAL1]ODV50071.1 MAG: hypothetical protein A8273_730 [Methanohalophilus sp. 2-GBenrich]PQV43059.1 hypothetical protein B0H22_10368 [Methanohalophilus euhalobius]